MIRPEIKASIAKTVLCWLATSDAAGQPNVSPKEIFVSRGEDQIIIANVASPQTLRNIRQNPRVCVSVLDILVQKGWQLKGEARIVSKKDPEFAEMAEPLLAMSGGNFPFNPIFAVTTDLVKPILAPSYVLYPEKTTEEAQIASARRTYGL